MTGSVSDLGNAVRTAAADLPLDGTAVASARLDEARALLTEALVESVEPVGLPDLNRAQTHLDRAVTQLIAAAEHLDEYLTAIGLAPAGDRGDLRAPASSAPAAPAADGRRSWWLERVDEISQADDDTRAKPDTEVEHTELTGLFELLVKTAAGGNRNEYRKRLHAADPAVGVRLPALSWPQIRTLATDFLGEAPTLKNLDKLRAKTRDRARELLPGLDDKAAETELAAACHLAQPTEERNPVDVAALGPILVAALIKARGSS